jgi:hypothetical protein
MRRHGTIVNGTAMVAELGWQAFPLTARLVLDQSLLDREH